MTTSGATNATRTRMQSSSAKPRTLHRRVGSALAGLHPSRHPRERHSGRYNQPIEVATTRTKGKRQKPGIRIVLPISTMSAKPAGKALAVLHD
jgi:hypothetical protein